MAVAGTKKKIFDDRYEIISIVGRGSRSVVYRARHIDGDQHEVALKVLLVKKQPNYSGSDLLRKEALAMVSSRHKYVIRLDDFHSVDELCYLSMEYAPEADLRKYVEKLGGTLPSDQAQLFLSQSAEALNFIHLAGILHRDIKPDNILVVDKGNIRIGDFGVAVLPGEESSVEDLKSGVGTMSYMAPEVLDGSGYDQRADVYALGVVFYEMLSGKHPFEGAPLAQQLEIRRNENFPALSAIAQNIPPPLESVIMRAMSYDPAARFQTARELIQTLQAAPADAAPAASEAPPRKLEAVPDANEAPPEAAPEPIPEPAPEPAPKPEPIAAIPEEARPAQPPTAPAEVPTPTPSHPPKEKQDTESVQESRDSSVDDQPDEGQANPKSLKRKRRRRRRRPRQGIRTTRQGQIQDEDQNDESAEQSNEEPVASEPQAAPSQQEAVPASSGRGPGGIGLGSQVVQSAFAGQDSPSDEPEAAPFVELVEEAAAEPTHSEKIPEQVAAEDPIVVEPTAETPAPYQAEQPPVEVQDNDDTAYNEDDPELILEPEPYEASTEPVSSEPSPASAAGMMASAFAAGSTPNRADGDEVESAEEAAPPGSKKMGPSDIFGIQTASTDVSAGPTRKKSHKKKKSPAKRSPNGFPLPLLVGAALIAVVIYILPDYMGGGEEDFDEGAGGLLIETAPDQRADLNAIVFPLLPAGIYSGAITGIVPGESVPLTVISTTDYDSLTVVVGISGWTPTTTALSELKRSIEETGEASIRIASNAIVMDLKGENVGGELSGVVRNISTGETGEWNIKPVN